MRRAATPGARGHVTLSVSKARRCGPTGTAPAPPAARRYPAEIAGRCQSRRGDSVSAGSEVAPGRDAAGRWSEGVLTKPKPQAARYPAGCPPLSAAKCGEAEEACPNVWRGNGGGTPPEPTGKAARGRESRYPGERERGEPISARYPAGVAGCRDPRRYPAAVAPAGRAATPRAPARRDSADAERGTLPAGREQRREDTTVARCKEACLPRAIPRGVQADAGAQCPPAILRACAPVGMGWERLRQRIAERSPWRPPS